MSANYGNIRIENIEANTRNVTINCKYTNVELGLSDNYAFDYEFSLSYGNLNTRLPLTHTEKKERNTSAYFKGHYKKSGTNKVYVSSEYGNVKLGRL